MAVRQAVDSTILYGSPLLSNKVQEFASPPSSTLVAQLLSYEQDFPRNIDSGDLENEPEES